METSSMDLMEVWDQDEEERLIPDEEEMKVPLTGD